MKKTIKYCLFAVLSLVQFQSCAHEELFVEGINIQQEELIEYVNEDSATKDPVFYFDPKRWGIVEGGVSDDVAVKNREIFNAIMEKLSRMGIAKMEVGPMDAYFNVNARVNNYEIKFQTAIRIPSNFELVMSDEVFLRVQPNSAHTYSLMMVFKGENIKISGGNLIGDRWEHDYTPEVDLYGNEWNAHDWGHIIQIAGGKNIEVNGVKISNATGDGIVVCESVIRTDANAVISENVVIKNCDISEIRRNGLSFLDGNGILLENCNVRETGKGPENPKGVYNTAGAYPKYGISFEAYRGRDEDNNLIEYQRIENVEIRGNRFTGNYGGDINLYTCSNVNIHNNYFDSMIANIASHSITIKDNVMEARKESDGSYYEFGLLFKSKLDPHGNEMNYDYTISGNEIKNYINAIVLGGENYKVENNKLIDFKAGITFYKYLNGAQLSNNTFESSVEASSGYASLVANTTDVSVINENISVLYRPLNISGLKANVLRNLTFDNCIFNSIDGKLNSISGSENITVKNSRLNTQINVFNSLNINLLNNLF
ncbi:right-handed parallel beta-helix repeat-containing protein [Tamlana crocina]